MRSARQSHILGLWAVLAVWTFWRLVLAVVMPLTPDEAYYSLWARHLQGGYYDHPFMVALWIRAGVVLFGPQVWAMRLCGILAAFLASLAFYDTARCFFPAVKDFSGRQISSQSVLFLNSTLVFGLGMAVITPDTPLLFFAIISLWAFTRALFARKFWQSAIFWACTGLFVGLGADSKYTMVFPAAGMAGFVLFDRCRLWRQPVLYIAPALAVLAFLPVLLWNRAHYWASFCKQAGRVGDWQPCHAIRFLAELLGGQAGLMTPLLFCLCCWGVIMLVSGMFAKKTEDSRENQLARLLPWLILPGGMFFVIHAIGGRVQANWPVVLYPPLLLAGLWIARQQDITERLARYGIGLAFVMQLVLSVQILWPVMPVSAHFDPIARQSAGWAGLAQTIEQQMAEERGAGLFIEDYALASILVVQPGFTVPVFSPDRRWAFLSGMSWQYGGTLWTLAEDKKHWDMRQNNKDSERGQPYYLYRLRHNGIVKGQMVRAYRFSPIEQGAGFLVNP